MSNNLLRKPRSMGNLLPPNYISDEGRFDLNLPRIRPAWLMNESIKSLDSKFPMVPAPTGSIVFYTTPLGEKLRQIPKDMEFDLTDPLRPSHSYNCLHDQHLQVYFRSNDIRKRMLDEDFITDDGYVKCSLKEFNEYRQWIRKLKLDELHRERGQDEKQIEEAKKERLERIALERDPELLEILKRRREKRREEAKIHQKRIKREQDRLRKLEEMDRQRRENFVDIRRKTRDRIQIKRDLERERLRKKKCDNEHQEHKIKLRIVRKIHKDNDEKLKHLEERKKEAKELKIKKLDEQWLRRESWSIEHHNHQKNLREFQTQEFQQHVEERTAKIARQRRFSEVSYNEIAEANRRAFESQLEKAEVFLAKLNDKKAEELKKWRRKFDAMQKSSHSTLGSQSNPSCLIQKVKQRARRQSAWDLESCLLKDLGIAEQEIKENSYSKLGVISRTNELGFLGDAMGALGSLLEETDDEGQTHNKEFRFSIPTIVESFASLQPSSDKSDSDSEYSFHIPSVFRFESFHNLQRISDSPEIKPNDHIPEGELRTLVRNYVQGVLRQSADVLGVDIKFQERTPRERIPRITDVKRIPKLKAKEIDAGDTNMRVKVKEYLSGVLDKVEDKMQISIKRPPEYEKIKQEKQPVAQLPVETSVEDIIDNKLHYHSKRNVVRLYLCKIVEDAAEQCQVDVKFPPQYQSFVKRLYRPRRKVPSNKGASSDLAGKMAGQHTVVLRAITSGTVVLESAEQQRFISSPAITSEIKRTASAIEEMRNKYDKVRAERLFHENLLMIATRTVIQALHDAVVVVRAQRRNSDFFMSDLPNLYLEDASPSSHKEQAVLLKQQRSRHRRESLKTNDIEHIPREVDFLSKVFAKKGTGSEDEKGGKHISFQSTSQPSKQSEKKVAKYEKLYKTNNAGKKTGSENKGAGKTGKGTGTKKGDEKKKGQGTDASRKVGEGTGKESEDVEQEIGVSSQKVRSSVTISVKIEPIADVHVAKEIVEGEARIKEIETDGDPKQPGESEVTETEKLKEKETNDETLTVEQSTGDEPNGTEGNKLHVSEVKCTATSELNLGDKLGDDGIEAPVSTLSMKSPSLPQVTPQPSGFGLPPDSLRSGAVPPNTETTSDRPTAGSPSSAIFRMISMRETRENCDLSPESSYVVLPTLTSSEGALINARMEQMFNNDWSKSKGLESTPSLPALSRTPSKEAHATSCVAADHTTELVKLPSVPSVESCTSRPPTPVRSPSRSSQVALPQIDGSNTSLVGNNEPTQVTKTKPETKTNDPPQNTRTKTLPIVATPSKTTAAAKAHAKPTPPPKNTQGQKLQPGRPPARAKSEISRKPIATPALPPRKGGQVRSTTAIVTPKAATPGQQRKYVEAASSTQQRKSLEAATPTQAKKPVEQRKSLDTPQDRLAKSKSTGEAIIAARRNSLAGSQSKRRPSEATVRTGSIAEPDKNSGIAAKSTNRKSSTCVKAPSLKTESGSQMQKKEKTDVSQKSDTQTSKDVNATAKSSKPVPRKSSQDVKTKPTQDVHATSTQDTHAKSTLQDTHAKSTRDAKSTQNANVKSTQDNQTTSAHDNNKAKPAKENFAKSTQDAHAKATQDVHARSTNQAKSTQNANLKTTTSGTSKSTESKGKENSSKTADKSKADKNAHEKVNAETQESKDLQATNLNALTLKELKEKSKSVPGKDIKTTPITQTPAKISTKEPQQTPAKTSTKEPQQTPAKTSPTEPQTTSKPFPYQRDTIVDSPDSISPTQFSPKLTPESSPTPKEANVASGEEIAEKPQAMRGALITSPDIEELARAGSPKVCEKKSSPLLKITESETDFYREQYNIRKLEGVDDHEPADEDLEDHSGNKRHISSDNKPKVPKGRKKITRHKPKDDEDGAKKADGEADVDDGVTKVSDSKAKISDSKEKVSDDTQNADQHEVDNADSKMSKTSVNGERKNSLKSNESLDTGYILRSSSKGSSVQAISKSSQENGKISKSRRSSRSVSFSSPLQHFPDTQKQKKESVDRLTKRRSSQKVAKKASSKDLKKRRSSFSSEHVKGKTKSSTEVTAKVESNRKVSNASISKSQTKTHKKSSKDVAVHKTKSEAKTKPEDAQETRVEDSQETRVEDTRETRVEDTQETSVEGTQETSVEESQETRVEDSQEIHVDDTREIGVDNTQETPVEDSQETRVENSQETRVDDTQETREGSDDNLRKSESDVEVVVQVYVPDEGQADVPDQVTKQTSQESGEKAEHAETGGENDVTAEGAANVTKIDLKVFPEEDAELGMKRVSSRRAFGDNVIEKNLVNIVPRNSMDIIKGIKLTPETKVTNRSFHSKTNLPRTPLVPKPGSRVARRNHPESRAIKVSNFELPEAGQGGMTLKPTQHGKAQMSMHRLASKMSTNLEKVDEGSALETAHSSTLSSKESGKLITALNISKAGVKTKSSSSGTEKDDLANSQEKAENLEENAEKKTEKVDESVEKNVNEKTEPIRAASNKSLQLLMKASSVCINSASFAGVVQGTPLLNKESVTANDDATGHSSSASLRSNSSQPLVPSPPITAKPDMVSPRISRMMSRNMSNGSGKSHGSYGSANEMSPTASMEIVKLASNSSHGWVSSPTSSVKFLPPIDARASKASNRSDDSSTKRRPRTAESAVSRTGSVGSRSSSGSQTKAAVVEIRRSGSGDLRIDGSSSGLVGVKSPSSAGSPKQTVVGF